MLRSLPTYLRLILLQRLSRFTAGRAYAPKTERGTAVFAPLQRDGFAAIRLGSDAIAEIRNLLAPQLQDAGAARRRRAIRDAQPDLVDPRDGARPVSMVQPDRRRSRPDRSGERLSASGRSASAGSPPKSSMHRPRAGAVRSPMSASTSSPCDGFKVDPATNVLKLVIYLERRRRRPTDR